MALSSPEALCESDQVFDITAYLGLVHEGRAELQFAFEL